MTVSRARRSPSASTASVASIIAAVVMTSTAARAQSQSGFAVSRFEPAERGSQFFVVDTLDIRSGAYAAGAMLDYAYKPLVIYDAEGNERAALVRHQTFVHLGGSVTLFERLRLAINAPLAIYQDGEPALVRGKQLGAANAPAFGDVRLAADVRLLGAHAGPFTLAAGARAWLPTGLRSQFTGDGSTRVSPQIMASGVIGVVAWAARFALVYRSRDDDYAGRALGSELTGALGAGFRTHDGRLVVGPELGAASAFAGDARLFGKRETPVEWTFGAHYDVAETLRVGAGVGSGLGQGYGAPLVRALASLEWVSAPARAPVRSAQIREEPTPWEGTPGGEPPPSPPLATVSETQIHIFEAVTFATDSAELASSSDRVLSAVKRVMDEHPQIELLRIEGHTDATGEASYNEDLSARRAKAVVAWLVARGVAPERLDSVGLGSKEPLGTNDTEEGRAKNRRVVFRIVRRKD